MDSGLDEWLGKIFGQLTEIISQLGDVAKALEVIVKQVGKFKKVLDEISGGNGGGASFYCYQLFYLGLKP